MQPAKINYKIYQGSTFQETLRWESEIKTYVPISAISKAAPCVVTTTSAHSVPTNWRVRITGAAGMKEINSATQEAYYLATAVTSNTITFNQVNSLGYTPYTSGGVVEYNTPVSLLGYTAQLQIRETIDSTTVIHEMTSAANGGITLSLTDKTIFLSIPASVTRNFSFDTAVYSLELTSSGGTVIPFMLGNMSLVREVTR
jgi:hypothetical protein